MAIDNRCLHCGVQLPDNAASPHVCPRYTGAQMHPVLPQINFLVGAPQPQLNNPETLTAHQMHGYRLECEELREELRSAQLKEAREEIGRLKKQTVGDPEECRELYGRNFHGHDRGVVVTQPESGRFEERPMTAGELAARKPAMLIAAQIHKMACYAAFAYINAWEFIAPAIDEALRAKLSAPEASASAHGVVDEATAYLTRATDAEAKLFECCEQTRRLRFARNLADDENRTLRSELAAISEATKAVLSEARLSLKECSTLHTGELLEALDKLRAFLRATPSAPEASAVTVDGERWRHKKRGTTYRLVGYAQVQCSADSPLTEYEVVTVYRAEVGSIDDEHGLWVRRKSEFEDGRFEKLTPTTTGGGT